MAKIFKIEAAGWHDLIHGWWHLVLAGFIFSSIGIGLAFICYLLAPYFYKQVIVSTYDLFLGFHLSFSVAPFPLNNRLFRKSVSSSVKKHLLNTCAKLQPYKIQNTSKKPLSFGVYLGEVDNPPSEPQIRILSQWDLLLFEPSQAGVFAAMSSGLYPVSPQTVARLDVGEVVGHTDQSPVNWLVKWVETYLEMPRTSARRGHCFTGISISNWEIYLTVPLLQEFIKFAHALGFSIYLEASAPEFLSDPKLAEMEEVTGMIIRNGTLSTSGDERDAFQMNEMRPTIKAFVSQACLRSFVVLLWETLDDEVMPLNAVVKRSYQWSRFYSALPWIGSRSALHTASLAMDQKEPLGAFDWLKELPVMKIHEKWRFNQEISRSFNSNASETILQLHSVLDSTSEPFEGSKVRQSACLGHLSQANSLDRNSYFSKSPHSIKTLSISTDSAESDVSSASSSTLGALSWVPLLECPNARAISTSPTGISFNYLGCFPLGADVTSKAFDDVVRSQRRLRELNLLDDIKFGKLNDIGAQLSGFCDFLTQQGARSEPVWLPTVQNLAYQLSTTKENGLNRIRVQKGLDSGFQIHSGSRFWAVYAIDDEGTLDIYMSRNAHDITGVLLHTFLSSQGYSRQDCFQAEVVLAEWSNNLLQPSNLPLRIVDDIRLLAPSEILKFLQYLSISHEPRAPASIRHIQAACERQLLEGTDFSQLKKLSTTGYLSGKASPQDLINARLHWYEQDDCEHISAALALQNFFEIDYTISNMLKTRDFSALQKLTEYLSRCIEMDQIDSRVDLITFAVFCAMRKHAFDEAYMEVTDRNTLFNDQSDQAAAFAELFATGARCEAYFDTTPSAFGKLLSDRYRAYHHQKGHEPPIWTDVNPATPSAYAAAKIDVDPDIKKSELPTYKRVTFLSVFAVPALLDILLLTTTGQGLYLSSQMSSTEVHSATLALMISLLISGAVGTWITCGGSYYLISMAFSAMNMFVITRLVGGFAFTLAVALIGFIPVSIMTGGKAGVVFVLYLIALTMYLCLLACLANFQYPSSAFQSGRPIIITVIPFLFLSPIITICLPHHDIYIYLSVLYTFLFLLVLGVRHTGSKWTTWYLDIEKISDPQLRKWYIDKYCDGKDTTLAGFTEPGILKLAREALNKDIRKVRSSWRKTTTDSFVMALVKSYDATVFLLEWYSGYSGTPLPIPFSSTWNMQTKVALQTLRQLQTGIRLHNAFIHWRQAGDEVGCSLLYFVVALLDKWNSLLAGGELLGLLTTISKDQNFKSPVGYALAYYLIGAVLLDVNAVKLHTMTARGQNMLIGDVSSIPEAVRREVTARRFLYWKMLGRFLLLHVWSMALATSLIWVFDSTLESTILFLAYIVAYTGLLWFQYTKIFTGPRGLKPLIIAVVVGLPLGQLLRHYHSDFLYCDVIALGAATWTAAIAALWFARIKTKRSHAEYTASEKQFYDGKSQDGGVYHAFTTPGKDPLLSQGELRILFHNLQALRDEERYRVNPQTHPGLEIKSILLHALADYQDPRGSSSKFALEAFPEAAELLELTAFALERGAVIVECVPMAAMMDCFTEVKAIAHAIDTKLHIVIGCDLMHTYEEQTSIRIFCQMAAEVLIHAVAENLMGESHESACLAESLLTSGLASNTTQVGPVPTRIRNFLTGTRGSSQQAQSLARYCEDQALQFLSLGFKPDLQWEALPREIRELIIRRCTGQVVPLTKVQQNWLVYNQAHGMSLQTYLKRCDFGAYVAMTNRKYALGTRDEAITGKYYHQDTLDSLKFLRVTPPRSKLTTVEVLKSLKIPFSLVYHKLGICLKLLAIAFAADSDLIRELNYALKTWNPVSRKIVMVFITGVWRYTKRVQEVVMPLFLLHGRKNVSTLWGRIGGTTVSLKRQRIAIENADGHATAFISPQREDSTFEVRTYSGQMEKEPENRGGLQRLSIYTKSMLLIRREEYTKAGIKDNVYEYEYAPEVSRLPRKRLSKFKNPRYPILRKCVEGKDEFEEVNFNYRGLVQSGSYILHGSLIRFSCHYRQGSNFDDELLRAEFVLPHLTCTVSWSAPPQTHPEKLDKWIPHSQVTEATFVLGSDVYESRWSYDHKFHPTIHTTLNGEMIETPPIIKWDHLGVLKKPSKYGFQHDDPLISFKSLTPHFIPRFLGLNTHKNLVSTSRARSSLWNAWKNTPGFDGVMVRWLDERLLRKEPLLRLYWQKRDSGDLIGAEAFLNEHADGVMAAVDLDNSISGWAPLAIKIADLYSFGQGGDANSRTRSKALDFDDGGLQVLAVDSGTWPNEGGGVSACRRDMINNLKTVNWYMIAESANDSGLPKHQTEMNVRSLKIIPLWGLDFLTPTHGLFRDRLDTEVEHVPRDATKQDVGRNFVPILTALVKGARTSNFSQSDILQCTRALVNLNSYFSEEKHWGAIWTSTIVKEAWRSLWISPDLVRPTPSEGWFQTEIPTIAQLDAALELWYRYLFIFSIPIPDRIPAIFQASHHSVSASYGIVCKIKRGCTLQIWDHAISWRETNLYLSSDLCGMAPFIRNSLLGLMRITSQLILHHADTILPCADFFNPGWEVEIGTSQGAIEHRNTFRRKIDPVVNGIPDMTKFAPIKEIKTEKPTVTMLSHVWYAKDIKTAILAADIIVNEWGFTDYRLDIYGAIDKAPSYSTDCFEIIASKSLPRFVTMCGEANPTSVLEKTWVFLNSSISEGLPLALGEAALTGAPVVCTDVGASLRVLTDPDTGARYSAVVAPNDARNLARAQINFLAMLDEWAPYAGDPEGYIAPTIPDRPTQADIDKITKRMYAKTEERKALGMKSREIVQKSFGGERYLREHEQMLWIGKAKYDLQRPPTIPKLARPTGPSQPVPSNVWGTTSVPSALNHRFPPRSIQTPSMLSRSMSASTLLTPALSSVFDTNMTTTSGHPSLGSRTSTLLSGSFSPQTPTKTLPPRFAMLPRTQSDDSYARSIYRAKALPKEDTFIHDITHALERV